MTGCHVDQLLEEYLRVINDKDNQLQKLLRDTEELRFTHKRREDNLQSRVAKLKSVNAELAKTIAQLREKIAQDDVSINKLVLAAEALKGDLQAKQAEQQQTTQTLMELRQRTECEAEHHTKALAAAVQQAKASEIDRERAEDARRCIEAEADTQRMEIATLREQLRSSQEASHRAEEALATTQVHFKDAVPRREHEQRVAQLEERYTSEARQKEHELVALQQRMQRTDSDLKATQRALNQCQQDLQDSVAQREVSERAANELRQQIKLIDQEREHALETARRDVQQYKQMCAKATDAQAEAERVAAGKEEQLRRGMEALQESKLALERLRGQADKTEESLRTQLHAANEQANHYQSDAERLRRQLEHKESVLHDVSTSMAVCKEDSARAIAGLKDDLAAATAAVTARKDENDRLLHDLKHAQQELQDTHRRLSQEVGALQSKVSEYRATIQHAEQQLKGREEEARRLELVHDQALQALRHTHVVAIEELRRSKEEEVREVLARLERCRIELCDHSGGSKGLSQELERYALQRRQLQEELAHALSTSAAREEKVAELKRELENLRSKVSLQEHRDAARALEEEQLRRRADAAERAMEDARSALRRAEVALEEKARALQEHLETVARLQGEQQSHEHHVLALRRQIAEGREAEQAAHRDAASREAQANKLACRLAHCEAQLSEVREALAQAQQEGRDTQRAAKTAEQEVARLREELSERLSECKRTAQHAEEVEELARRTADELRQSVQSRDEVLAGMRKEQALLVPQLSEERSRNLVLQEKLQHQRELERVSAAALQDRIAELEATVRSREAEVAAAAALGSDARRRAEDLQVELQTLQEALEAKGRQHAACREELQSASDALQRERAEGAATTAVREKYKRERAKMEALLKQFEEETAKARRAEKASAEREAVLLKDLEAAEAALDAARADAGARIAAMKTQYEQRAEDREEACACAAEKAAAAEQRCGELRVALRVAKEEAAVVQSTCREMQRHLSLSSAERLSSYADEALAMKLQFTELVAQLRRAAVQHGAHGLHSSWLVAHQAARAYEARARELEDRMAHQLQRVKADGDAAMDAELRRHRAEVAQLVEQHGVLLEQCRQTASQQRTEDQREKEAVTHALLEKEEALHAAAMALESARADAQHLSKQLQTFRGQRDAAEMQVAELQRKEDEERYAQRRQQDSLVRQLEEKQVEQRHSEEELRELRAEVTALQRLLYEREDYLAKTKAQLRAESSRVGQAVAARDSVQAQLAEVLNQLEEAKAQMDAVKLAQQQCLERAQQTQQAAERRLDVLQAELAEATLERRRLQSEAETQTRKIQAMAKELQNLRRAEAELTGQTQVLKAEMSALRERCANLESLKNISEATLAEMHARERDLLEKLEELRNSQQLMQICFDKQQEQLEMGRCMREQHLNQRSLVRE